MARLDSWLSADVMHALGWALVHSLWQCLGLAALAAILMAFSRRPSIRYLVATGALVAMLAAPVATFFVLMKPAAPVRVLLPATPGPRLIAVLAAVTPSATPLGAAPHAMNNGAAIALEASPEYFLPPRFLSSDFLPPNILPWLVAAWLCGVAFFSLRLAGGFLLLDHRRRRQSNGPGPRILALCRELQHQLGLNRAIRYLECGWLQSPGVVGWIRPIVLLPVSALTGLSEAQLRAVIAHELAHIRRLDFFVNLLQSLVEALLFYHPAIWWLNRRIRIERELCCDDIAVSVTGDRLEYAKVLTLMAEWEKAPALAMAANRGPLSERIFHILGRKPFGAGQRILGVTGSILFLAAALGAANALFGIATPITTADAKASLKTASSSSRIAVDHTAQPVLQAGEAAAKDASPDQDSGNDPIGQETAAPDQTEAMATSQTQKLVVTPPDLSRLVSAGSLAAPARVASNDPPVAPPQPAPNPSPAVMTALNDQPGAPDAREAVTAKAECAAPELANSLRMEKVPDRNIMTVTASIDGSPEKLLVGIGDLSTQLWDTQAAKLDLAVLTRGRFMDAGGRFSEGVARIAGFTLGSMETGGFDIAVRPDPDFANAGFDGVLGTNMMQRYDIDLDFAHQQLNFFSPEQCKGAGIYWSPGTVASVQMVTYSGIVYVPVTLDGHRIIALLDTSADRTFLNPQVAERLFGLEAGSLEAGTVTDGGALIKAGMHTFSSLTFGGLTIANPQIAVPFDILTQDTQEFHASRVIRNTYHLSDFLPPMIIGMDVLKQSHLYISFRNQRIYVSAAGDGQALKQPAPTSTSWFNVWKYGYDAYLPYIHKLFEL